MKHFIVAFLLLFIIQKVDAQNPVDSGSHPIEIKAEITLHDGNVLRGTIIGRNDSTIVVRTDLLGQVTVPRSQILDIRYFMSNKKGNQQVHINLASRYFFSPSAINMKAGDGYFQISYFSLFSFNYAITDHFTIGAGSELFTLLIGRPIVLITPKFSFEMSENIHLGAGYLYANILNTGASLEGINVAYGNITLGNEDLSLTMNAGTSVVHPGDPLLTICGFSRLSSKFGLLTENWFIPLGNDYLNLYSFGGRVIGRKNLFDFGLVTNEDILSSSFILGIPYVSYTLRF